MLSLLAAGLNDQEIAERLVISLGTVTACVSNFCQKLGVERQVMAVKLALERELVSG